MLTAAGCAGQPPPAVSEAELLLELTGRVIQAGSAEQQRAIESARREAFEADPSPDTLLRLTLVRALTAALPAELEAVREDLLVLVDARAELTDSQRHLAKLALLLVDERLSLGMQIADLQRQIDSLTEIEASLNTGGTTERTP